MITAITTSLSKAFGFDLGEKIVTIFLSIIQDIVLIYYIVLKLS